MKINFFKLTNNQNIATMSLNYCKSIIPIAIIDCTGPLKVFIFRWKAKLNCMHLFRQEIVIPSEAIICDLN